ncbi:cytochrome c3 family protein [Bradyrhizobium sp. HKCCYLS2058]|uniref:cytochrome c3 family protein n=1 Tax=Bradyrhizobium TaxID=374 RepID=UPI0028F0FCCE|nr:cytochrome c3 family protein [Bradyrhizobium sp. SZCCHNS3002]
MRWRVAVVVAVLAGVAMLSAGGRAQTLLEKLVMPGPLVEKHAKLESECGKCHEAYTRKAQSGLCLDCHKEIAVDRRQRERLHGRDQAALSQECRQCHTDHKGRGTDIVQLDKETFNHDMTNYRLVDAHKTVPCAGCHVAKVKFRNAPSTCFECHKAIDPHRGRLGERCENCHTAVKWRATKEFDHTKTRFPLVGAHKSVACATCHSGQQYKDLPTSCGSCHRLQDVHGGRFGDKCETCHDQDKWKTVRFNHDKTRFPLRNAHAKVKCEGCHTGDLYRDKLATSCVSCHRKQDPHQGKLGERCETCHSDMGWRKKLSFDHEITRFPLIGLHKSVPCEECHRTPTYKNTPMACESCHKDFHQGKLGGRCANCHNPNGWRLWRFDHARQTRFPLVGVHQKITCEACHKAKSPPDLKLPMDCFSCHRSSDVHNGTFGQTCERCHVATGWRNVQIRN